MEKQELVEKAKQEAAKGPKGKAQVHPVPPDYTHDSATGGAQLWSDSWWHRYLTHQVPHVAGYYLNASNGMYFDAASGGYYSSSDGNWYSWDGSQFVQWTQ